MIRDLEILILKNLIDEILIRIILIQEGIDLKDLKDLGEREEGEIDLETLIREILIQEEIGIEWVEEDLIDHQDQIEMSCRTYLKQITLFKCVFVLGVMCKE